MSFDDFNFNYINQVLDFCFWWDKNAKINEEKKEQLEKSKKHEEYHQIMISFHK